MGKFGVARVLLAIGSLMAEPAVERADAAEQAVEVAGPQGPLRGTMVAPPAASAAVLIIPGSGPTDRDGNTALRVAAAPYRLLAEGLAAEGIASLRIDKRGLFASAGAVTDPNAVIIADYVADVQKWVSLLRARTDLPCVWLLGHSEGGLIALAAARQRDGICGLVLAATPGRPLGRVLRDQLASNPANAPLLEQAFAATAALEAGRRVDVSALHPALAALFRPAIQSFLIDSFAQDPAKLIAVWDGPALIVQGERDLQVSAADARFLHEAASGSTLAILPEANHVLKAVPASDPAANLAAYANPTLPLAPGLVARIAAFVRATHPAASRAAP